jgi:3-phenylpropionate/trans-cinnamate dioxygenase ferredoxin subunit
MPAVQVAAKSDIPPGTMKAFAVDGADVLVANCDDALYAVSNVCTHMGGNLSKGRLNGFLVECPLHGASFDLRTGANTAPPKVGSLGTKLADLKAYPVILEGKAIKVSV